MGNVAPHISMSLDGFIAGPNDGPERPLGDGGERLHEWVYDLASWRERHGLEGGKKDTDAEVLDEAFKNVGAVVIGRRMFDVANGWGDNPPFGACFVLTHRGQELGDGTRLFKNMGIELERTRVIEPPGVTHLRFRVVKED
jgi:dihydrofolate reductase